MLCFDDEMGRDLKVQGDLLGRHGRARFDSRSVPSVLVAFALIAPISILLKLLFSTVPLELLAISTFAGAIGVSDFVDVMRGRREFFSPRSLVSLLILNAMYVSPVLHCVLDAYPKYVTLPLNMGLAFANLSLVHLAGVLLYFATLRVLGSGDSTKSLPYRSRDDVDLLLVSRWCAVLGVISLAVFAYTVFSSGGPGAWLSSQLNYRESLSSSGWVLSIAEAFPTLFFVSYLAKLKTRELPQVQLRQLVVLALVVLAAVTFVSSGLRGSRANLIWPLLSALVLVHLMFFRIRGRSLAILGIVVLVFAGVYDVYKKAGPEAIVSLQEGTFQSSDEYGDLGIGPQSVLLGDFSRTGVQAIVLDRLIGDGFELSWGSTYVGGALLYIPGADLTEMFPTKSVVATEILHGVGAIESRDNLDTRIYGLQGEAMLNFGVVGAVLVFGPYALLMDRAELAFARAVRNRAFGSGLFIAMLIPACMLLFVSDLDNTIRYLTSKALLPLLALYLALLASRRGGAVFLNPVEGMGRP